MLHYACARAVTPVDPRSRGRYTMDMVTLQTSALLISILVSILGLVILGFFFGNRRLDDLRTDMNRHLTIVGERFVGIGERFGSVETRIGSVETRIASLEAHVDSGFDRVEGRFQQMEGRFQRIEERLERIDARFARMDDRFAAADARMTQVHQDLLGLRTLLQDALRPRTA